MITQQATQIESLYRASPPQNQDKDEENNKDEEGESNGVVVDDLNLNLNSASRVEAREAKKDAAIKKSLVFTVGTIAWAPITSRARAGSDGSRPVVVARGGIAP